jgi:hypothetical protein
MRMTVVANNVPLINLRTEFEQYLRLFRNADFKQAVFGCRLRPVRIPSLTWNGMPNDLLTLMLQRTIVGLECYVAAAVDYELSKRGPLTPEAISSLNNRFSLDRSAVVALYDKLPELVDASLKLSAWNSALFSEIRFFYKSVRNPIFHGRQIVFSGDSYDHVASAFELIAGVYDWIDAWYTAFPTGWQHMRATNKAMQAS